MGNDMFNEEQLAYAAERADAAVLKESLTTDLGFDFVAYAREVMADKNHKDRDDLSCLAMEIVGALVSSIDRLQGRLDSLHRSKVEYATAERDSLRLALETATRERDGWQARALVAERDRDDAKASVAGAQGALRLCEVPEQIPPFKTALAPAAARIMYLGHERDALLARLAAPPADAATEAVREAAEAIIAEGVGNLVSHVPRHECIGDAGVIMVKPACSCGWSRSALYPADGHLVFAAYHTHLVACRVGNEELTAALHASAGTLRAVLSTPAPAPSAKEGRT